MKTMTRKLYLNRRQSLKLFGGLNKLHRHIADSVAELGFHACTACAPTPLAALWFARAGLNVRLQHPDALRHALSQAIRFR